MIRIKAVDAQNILDVCALTSGREGAAEGCPGCNAVSIAEAKYNPELHPNAIYSNNALIGFFMYERAEDHAGTATLLRFMVDGRFQSKGLEEKALERVLRGLKIQGVKRVILTDGGAKGLYLSFGFRPAGETGEPGCRYELDLE